MDNGLYTAKLTGTGTHLSASLVRNTYALASGSEVRLEFKVDGTETLAHFSLEAGTAGTSTYRRWGLIGRWGKLCVQYNDSGYDNNTYVDLINPVKLNTWYVATIRVQNATNGFRIEVHERDNPSVVATYTNSSSASWAKTWRFRHMLQTGNAWLAHYVERKVSQTTVYVGNLYEKNTTTGEVTKYYYAGGPRIALRRGSTLSYLLSDHLGGTWAVVDTGGVNPTRSFYYS